MLKDPESNLLIDYIINANSSSSNITSNQKLIKTMLINMRFVSFMSNIWTIIVALTLIIQLGKQFMKIRSDSSISIYGRHLK